MPQVAGDIGQTIQSYITTDLTVGQFIGLQDDLLLSGLIDSLSIVRLVAFIEGEYQVKIPPEDVTVANMATIEAISIYVTKLIGGTAEN